MKECNCHRGPEVGKRVIGCPPKVININHPQEPVLFHRVDVPAAMGDDTTYPPENGLYKNVLLVYEANNHIYLYNSDGIPTSLTVNTSEIEETLEDLGIRLAQETEDRFETDVALRADIDQVADDLEEFKNSPDVVDIVATYVDLQAYDTSELGDKDVIRVLIDETHDNESSYYRWSTTTQTWTFIGATGPYYTKDETDDIVEAAKGAPKELTSENYNWPTADPDGIAAWTLEPGFYNTSRGVKIYWTSSSQGVDYAPFEFIVANRGNSGEKSINIFPNALCMVHDDGSVILDTTFLMVSQVADNLTSTSPSLPLSANQGRILKDLMDSNAGKAKALSSADYNWNSVTMDATEPYDSVALWRLDPGLYTVPNGVPGYICKNGTALYSASYKKLFQVTPQGTYSKMIICWEEDHIADSSPMTVAKVYGVSVNTGDFSHTITIGSPIYNISSPGTNRTEIPLAASVGHTLNKNIGDLSTLTTTNKTSAVAAINELAARITALENA